MANKLVFFILMMSGLTLLFHFTGLTQNCSDGLCEGETPSSRLLDLLLNPESLSLSSLYDEALVVLAGLAGASIIIGLGITGGAETALRGTFMIFLGVTLWDFLYIVGKVMSINPIFATLIFSPLLIVFIVTLIDWMGKSDT